MNVVLIGYRGTGKTAIGRLLAGRLNMTYVGLDDEIVRRAGKTIPEIVRDGGWPAFREREAEVVREAGLRDGCVLDTGGGAILRRENVDRLRAGGMVFWLQASVADMVRRIRGDDQRPSLTGAGSATAEVETVLAERTPKYREAADVTVNTSALSISEAVTQIAEAFRARERETQ